MIGHGAIELGAREGRLVVGELLDRPAAERVDPLTPRRGLRAGTQKLQRRLARFHAVEPHLVLPRGAGTQQMHVVVDEPGDDRAAAQIEAPGRGSGERGDVAVTPNGDNALAADRDRGGNREATVDGDDLAVRENDVCGLRLGSRHHDCRRDSSQPQRNGNWLPVHGL